MAAHRANEDRQIDHRKGDTLESFPMDKDFSCRTYHVFHTREPIFSSLDIWDSRIALLCFCGQRFSEQEYDRVGSE